MQQASKKKPLLMV